MAEFITTSATLRVTNEDKRRVFSASKVSPRVSAQTVAGFVSAVEKLYNNGQCAAVVNISMNLER